MSNEKLEMRIDYVQRKKNRRILMQVYSILAGLMVLDAGMGCLYYMREDIKENPTKYAGQNPIQKVATYMNLQTHFGTDREHE